MLQLIQKLTTSEQLQNHNFLQQNCRVKCATMKWMILYAKQDYLYKHVKFNFNALTI